MTFRISTSTGWSSGADAWNRGASRWKQGRATCRIRWLPPWAEAGEQGLPVRENADDEPASVSTQLKLRAMSDRRRMRSGLGSHCEGCAHHRNRGNKCQPSSPNSSRTHAQTRRVCRSRGHPSHGQPEPRGWSPRPALELAPAQVDARHDTEHRGHLCTSWQSRMRPSPASRPLRPACLGIHPERTGIPVTDQVSNHCPSPTRHHGQRTNVLLCRHLASCPAPSQPSKHHVHSRHPSPRGTGSRHLQGPTQC